MRAIIILVVCALCFVPYAWNGYKLSQCDFESDYKCEIIHGIGVVIAPTAWIAVWFDDDSMQGDL